MTIDEAVKSISDIDKAYRSFSDNEYEALNIAVDTMRKYQKIQKIVKNTQQLCSYGSAFIDIREVIEEWES